MTQTGSRGPTENFAEKAITQTTDIDAVFGSEPFHPGPGMNKAEQQSWRNDLKESQVDPPEVDEDRGSGSWISNLEKSSIYSQVWSPDLRVGNCNNIAILLPLITFYCNK